MSMWYSLVTSVIEYYVGVKKNILWVHYFAVFVGEQVKAEVEVKEKSGNRMLLTMTCTENDLRKGKPLV